MFPLQRKRHRRIFGAEVDRIYDVGVSGLHRLLAQLDRIQKANCVVAVAGMEGALASVIGGLVSNPVIAVPTSVGYGASMHGISALLTMINSCANGVAVVNIDNGYGAGYMAAQINRLAVCKPKQDRNITSKKRKYYRKQISGGRQWSILIVTV